VVGAGLLIDRQTVVVVPGQPLEEEAKVSFPSPYPWVEQSAHHMQVDWTYLADSRRAT